MANCRASLGRPEQAVRDLSNRTRSARSRCAFLAALSRTAQILEGAFKDRDAKRAYQRVTSNADDLHRTEVPLPELARLGPLRAWRARERWKLSPIVSPRRWFVRSKSGTSGRWLAWRRERTSRCGVAGAETDFRDFAKLEARLKQDLGRSKVVADPAALLGSGGKLYLQTDGWSGEVLTGRVYFILARVRDGWEWRGVALTRIDESFFKLFPPAVPETNQPLELPIKAPYPKDTCFRVGGLARFPRIVSPIRRRVHRCVGYVQLLRLRPGRLLLQPGADASGPGRIRHRLHALPAPASHSGTPQEVSLSWPCN